MASDEQTPDLPCPFCVGLSAAPHCAVCHDKGRAPWTRFVGPCVAGFETLGGMEGILDRIKHAEMPYQQAAWELLRDGIEKRRAENGTA